MKDMECVRKRPFDRVAGFWPDNGATNAPRDAEALRDWRVA